MLMSILSLKNFTSLSSVTECKACWIEHCLGCSAKHACRRGTIVNCQQNIVTTHHLVFINQPAQHTLVVPGVPSLQVQVQLLRLLHGHISQMSMRHLQCEVLYNCHFEHYLKTYTSWHEQTVVNNPTTQLSVMFVNSLYSEKSQKGWNTNFRTKLHAAANCKKFIVCRVEWLDEDDII